MRTINLFFWYFKKPTEGMSNGTGESQDKKNTLLDASDNYDFMEEKEDTSKLLFTFTTAILVIALGFWVYLYFAKVKNESQLATLNTQFDELQIKYQNLLYWK
jgi:hypothetical protein